MLRRSARAWAAVTLVAVLLTLPVSGTGLTLTDQYLHPRALATAVILAAIVAVLGPTRAAVAGRRAAGGSIFPACHHGRIRRVVLFVSAVEAVGADTNSASSAPL